MNRSGGRTTRLFGEVDAVSLRNLLVGSSASGDDLGARLSKGRRPGYDLTLFAPKGATLLWASGPRGTSDDISVAHDRAVLSVLDHLSSEACYARPRSSGHELVEGTGFAAAAFRRRTSQASDPQLDPHVVGPNLVQGTDGQWSAPDGRQLYAWASCVISP